MARSSKKIEGETDNTISDKDAKNVVKMGGNIGPLKDDIKSARDRVIQLKADRAAINADLKAIREDLEAKGVPKKAFDAALRHYEASPEQREGFDEGYILAREGMEIAISGAQMDMFDGKAVAAGS